MTERKQKLWDYFILFARVLIAYTFLSYGWAKLSEGQFGLSAKELATSFAEAIPVLSRKIEISL